MGPGGCRSSRPITVRMGAKRVLEGSARQPSRRKADRDIKAAEPLESMDKAGNQSIEGAPSSGRDRCAIAQKLGIPRRNLPAPRPQRRIALLQRAVIASPLGAEPRFHVEHKPVQPSSPALWSLIHELVDLRIDSLHGEDARKF